MSVQVSMLPAETQGEDEARGCDAHTPMARALRILLLIDSLGLGGAERLMVPLAVGLRQRGVDARVRYLVHREGDPVAVDLRAAGVPVASLDLRTLFDPIPLLRLASELRRERVDVLHTHLRYSDLIGRAAAVLACRPIVSTIHTIVETEGGWRAAVRRRLYYASARATTVIAVSEAQRQAYLKVARLDPKRVETHWNGVDTARFRPDPRARAEVRTALGIADESPLFATVVVLRPGKGIEHLLDAAARLSPMAPGARFLIVGDGDEREGLQRRAMQLGLRSAVVFMGARDDVPRLLAAADAYIHPSLFEALPTSVLEAMATGLPVVATLVGGVPEIVMHGRTGLLVQPAHPDELATAMHRLLDPSARAMLGAAGRAWVLGHASTEIWLDGLEQLYRRLAGGGA